MQYTPKFARRVLRDIKAMDADIAERMLDEVEAVCTDLYGARRRAEVRGLWMTNHPLPVGVAYGFLFKRHDRQHLGVIIFQIDQNESELHVLLLRDRPQ